MHNNKSSTTFHFIIYLFLMLIALGARPLLANDLYSVEPYIDFSTQGVQKAAWLAPIANTTQDDELFFVNIQGEVYRSKGQKVAATPIINLSKYLESQNPVKFTAFTLHPSFHLPDQEGSHVIYTAHIETFDPLIKHNRLTIAEMELSHSHDAVITEWQLSNVSNNNVNAINQREVLRIATNSEDTHINQLSFNPYLKSWSDDFGLLYIAFDRDQEFRNSALYSGTILRINPSKFGLKNYTIPRNNPFVKNPYIEDEIVILGAQKIQHFTWSKKTRDQLILTHEFDKIQKVSVASIGSDYLQTKPSNVIYERDAQENLLSTVYYRSRELNSLWNKILFIENKNNQWQLSATNVASQTEAETSPLAVLTLNPKQIDADSQLSLYIPRENELLIWDHSQAIIYKVLPHLSAETTHTENEIPAEKSGSNIFLYIFIILIFLALAFVYIKKKYGQNFIRNKSFLRSNFARFDFDTKTNEISLFKRHETQINTTIYSLDIVSSEIWLNNTLINTVSLDTGHGFNEQKDKALRLRFELEHRDKMVDDKVRQISVKLTTSKLNQYHICAYLREGNQRLTKEKYHSVIDHIIDWNWYFSSVVNEQETPERPAKVVIEKKIIVPKQVIKPSIKKEPVKSSKEASESEAAVEIKTTNTTQEAIADVKTESPKNSPVKGNNAKSTAKVDTKLIEALNKLAVLKEQGYLTEEEFVLAKANLLESLSTSSSD